MVAGVVAPADAASEVQTGTVPITELQPLLPDLAVGKYGKDFITQNVTIESDVDNTSRICVKPVLITQPVTAANDTCLEVCNDVADATVTCNKSSTDGEWLDPGEVLELRLTARFCVCGEATADTPTYQGKRLAR